MGLERPLQARRSGLEGLADKGLVLGAGRMLGLPRFDLLFWAHSVGAVSGFIHDF